jgi:hypothetical protein
LLVLLLAATVIFLIAPFQVKGDVIEGERTFSSTAQDAQLSYIGPFVSAWGVYHASWLDSAAQEMYVGYETVGASYNIARSAVLFDTTGIPAGATVTGAVLSLYVVTDGSTVDFNVTLQGTGIYPHSPVQTVDYYRGWYGTGSYGSRATGDGLSAGSFWNITLNSAGLAQIDTGGLTRFLLRSSLDVSGTGAANPAYITVASRDKGESYAAKLIVTYEVGTEAQFNYYFYGPYTDGGSVYNGSVSAVLYQSYNSTISFTLTGDGSTPDNYTVQLEQQATAIVWNVSSTYNYSRSISFTSTSHTETIYLCIPSSDLPYYLYSFTVNDLAGLSQGFLESQLYIAGSMRVVERQRLDMINAAPFYMGWSTVYKMRITSDQGVIDMGEFTALAETTPTLIIAAGSIPYESDTLNATASATRVNATYIRAAYVDGSQKTVSVTVNFEVKNSSNLYETVYSTTSISQALTVNWYDAVDGTNYRVSILAEQQDETTKTWRFMCYALTPEDSNIWGPLAILGSFPIPPQYLVGVAIVVAVILSFSFVHISAAAWFGWVAAVVLTIFGWLPYNTESQVVLGFAAVIAALITIAEFKKHEREM